MSKSKIKPVYQTHHIDWNHDNNDPNNLIEIPAIVHTVIHQYAVHDKDEIINLYKIYLLAKEKSQQEIKDILAKDPGLNSIEEHKWHELVNMPEPLLPCENNKKDFIQLFFDF